MWLRQPQRWILIWNLLFAKKKKMKTFLASFFLLLFLLNSIYDMFSCRSEHDIVKLAQENNWRKLIEFIRFIWKLVCCGKNSFHSFSFQFFSLENSKMCMTLQFSGFISEKIYAWLCRFYVFFFFGARHVSFHFNVERTKRNNKLLFITMPSEVFQRWYGTSYIYISSSMKENENEKKKTQL